MGYLTTVTIYNDHFSDIEKNPKEFVEGIKHHMNRGSRRSGSVIGQSKVHKTRHADDHTVYVHMGNTVVEMNPYSDDTKRIIEEHPRFAADLLQHLEYTVEALKNEMKGKE